MTHKPRTAMEYGSHHVNLVRRTCLTLATRLGDLLDEMVIVGGLVPSLLIDQEALPIGTNSHVGTMDLDVGLALALLEQERYHQFSDRLRAAGFSPDHTLDGRLTRQRWRGSGPGSVTVDFLIPPSREFDQAGRLRDLEPDFAAIIAPGLRLAFLDFRRVRIDGKTLLEENASREIRVCGPGAFVILKALAFEGRGENKDAYDLFYVIRNFGDGVSDVADALHPLLKDTEAQRAMGVLKRDFLDHDALGPRRVAEFIHGGPDAGTQADVAGFIRRLLDHAGC